jgi:uncharacterized protein YbjT (DUF2867 family)
VTVGITGASGHLAASAVAYLLERVSPSDVIALTRTPAKLDTLTRQGIRVRSADFNDPSGLAKAFEGVNRLLVIPTPDLMPGVRPRQHSAAIDAAVAAGVAHITYISTVGAHPGSSDGLPESHFATEQRLMTSSAAWNVLRMSLFAETLIDPATRAAGSGTWSAPESAPISYVARDDVAAAAAVQGSQATFTASKTNSASSFVTASKFPPTVTLTAPANGSATNDATPTLSGGRVYTFGATGILNALGAADGAVLWSHNVASDTGKKVPDWGFSSSPLVTDDVVIVAAAGQLDAKLKSNRRECVLYRHAAVYGIPVPIAITPVKTAVKILCYRKSRRLQTRSE